MFPAVTGLWPLGHEERCETCPIISSTFSVTHDGPWNEKKIDLSAKHLPTKPQIGVLHIPLFDKAHRSRIPQYWESEQFLAKRTGLGKQEK